VARWIRSDTALSSVVDSLYSTHSDRFLHSGQRCATDGGPRVPVILHAYHKRPHLTLPIVFRAPHPWSSFNSLSLCGACTLTCTYSQCADPHLGGKLGGLDDGLCQLRVTYSGPLRPQITTPSLHHLSLRIILKREVSPPATLFARYKTQRCIIYLENRASQALT